MYAIFVSVYIAAGRSWFWATWAPEANANRPGRTRVQWFNHGGTSMDAHFNEYLAAVAGLNEVYGAAGEEPAAEDRASETAEAATAA